MKYCHYLFVALGITSAAILASCQDEDFGYTSDQIAYRTNFEKMYGSVKDIPTWDFSSYNLRQMGLAGGPSYSSITRAGVRPANYTGTVTGATVGDGIIKNQITEGIDISSYGDYYSVQQGTLDWLNANLPEGVRTPLNVTKGNPFVLGVPDTDFAIIPIYQGHAGMCWDLHLVANDGSELKDYTIWSKSQGIKHDLDFSKLKTNGALTNGEEFNYDVKPFNEGGYVSYWGDGYGNSGIERIHFKNGANKHFAFPGVENRTGKDGNGDYVQVWFQLPAGATITGYFAAIDGEGNETAIWGKTGKDYTTLGESYSTAEQWICYDLIDGSGNKWNNGFFNELTWHNMGTNNCQFSSWENDRVRIYTRYNYNYTKTLDYPSDNWDTSNLTGNTVNRTGVGAKPILIDHTKIKNDFFLYLKITKADPDNSSYASVNDCQRSDEGMMVALPLTRPDNIDDSKEYMIIGCEDSANPAASDWDVNDIVFLLVGQGKLPRVKETITKRYMIEDLGSTFDFDFNDIVVDVSGTIVKQYDGTIEDYVNETATISHLCGTIPFQLKIGETVLPYVSDPTNETTTNTELSSALPSDFDTRAVNWDPNKTISISGWNPNTNNIYVKVWPQKKTSNGVGNPDNAGDNFSDFSSIPTEGDFGVMNFAFPNNGDYPYIIAVDPSVNWMPELKSVPDYWFKTWPDQYYDYNSGNGGTHGGNNGGSSTPQRVTITLQDNNQLNISDLSSAKTTDKVEFAISFDLSKAPVDFATTWGIGGFADDSTENWTVAGTGWTYGGPSPASNSNWTQEVSVGDIRSLATTLGHSTYIKLNVYNGCSIESVTLVKQ